MKEERIPHTGRPLGWREMSQHRGRDWKPRRKAQQPVRGRQIRESRRWSLSPPSPPQAETLGQGLGADTRAVVIGPGRGLALAVWKQTKGARECVSQLKECERSLGPPKKQGATVGECKGWGTNQQRNFFLCAQGSQAAGFRLCRLQGQVQAATAISDSQG